jgi:hypothetical protein
MLATEGMVGAVFYLRLRLNIMGILEILLAYSARQPLAKEKMAHCAEEKKQKIFFKHLLF